MWWRGLQGGRQQPSVAGMHWWGALSCTVLAWSAGAQGPPSAPPPGPAHCYQHCSQVYSLHTNQFEQVRQNSIVLVATKRP